MTRMSSYHLLRRPIEFVTATPDPTEPDHADDDSAQPPANPLSGDEAKDFYLSLVGSSSEPDVKPDVSKVKVPRKLNAKPYDRKAKLKPTKKIKQEKSDTAADQSKTTVKFFRAAADGDLRAVKDCVENLNVDVEAKDGFAWTALMMASHHGHMDVVKYLMFNGAKWDTTYDGSGYDAYDVACLGGHDHVAHFLQHSARHMRRERVELAYLRASRDIKQERVWCDTCREHYTSSHQDSVAHQFAAMRGAKPPPTHYFLDQSNRGYHMLVRKGWDGESGLGPDGKGKKYPVRTVLKRDRGGLGMDGDRRPAVTHFAAHDAGAVAECSTNRKRGEKSRGKQEESRREAKRKELEINFRREFH